MINQLRHAADLADASRPYSLGRAAGHIVAILDDLGRELRILRAVRRRSPGAEPEGSVTTTADRRV